MGKSFLLVFTLLVSGNIYADAASKYNEMVAKAEKDRAEYEKKKGSDFETEMEGQRKAWADYKIKREKYEKELAKLKGEKEALEKEVATTKEQQEYMQERVDKTTKEVNDYVEANKLKDPTGNGVIFGLGTTKVQDKYNKLRDEMRTAEENFKRIEGKLNETRGNLERHGRAIAAGETSLSETAAKMDAYGKGYHYVKDNKAAQEKGWTEERARTLASEVDSHALELYRDMQKDHYEAQLLLTDFATLQGKHQIDGLKLEMLKQRNSEFLKNTLIGDFVDKSIKAGYDSKEFCEAANKCIGGSGEESAKKIADLARRLDDVTKLVGEKKGKDVKDGKK